MEHNDFLWTEKYRPKTVQDTILPKGLKDIFQQFVDQNNVPTLLLTGGAGVGKTTVAKAMLEQLGCDYIVINGSLNGNIDTLRFDILNFASTVSLTGTGRKYVIIDEADYLNPNSTQPALRNFMEEYSRNCGFILTCNYVNRIIEPLRSRCSEINFRINKKDTAKLAMQFLKRVITILDTEKVPYDKAVVAEVIQKHFPDWRRVLNELQTYAASGGIDSGILVNLQEISLEEMFSLIKDKDFTGLRKWTAENMDNDQQYIFRTIYDVADKYIDKSSIPILVMLLAKYQYQAAFVADLELNLLAFLAEIMVSLEYI